VRISVPYSENYDIIFIYFMLWLFEVRIQKALSESCIKYSKDGHRNWHRSQASPSD